MPTQEIAIYGAGGFAREAAWLAETCGFTVVCLIDDNTANVGKIINDIPVMSLEQAHLRYPNIGIVLGIGSPKARESTMNKALALGLKPTTLIHPRTEISRWVSIEEGSVICAGNILTTNVAVGKCVQINPHCTIGHDAVLGDFVTLTPGVHIAGYVQLGKRVFVGTGATIINGTSDRPLIIEDDVVIGAGACVTKSVSANLTVVGVPAKPIQK